VDIEKMMSAYRMKFGWDGQTGEPTSKTIRRLGIG